jgi:hypothetical protein
MYSCMKMEQWDLLKLFLEGEREDKGEIWRGESKTHIVHTFVNVTMYPSIDSMC